MRIFSFLPKSFTDSIWIGLEDLSDFRYNKWALRVYFLSSQSITIYDGLNFRHTKILQEELYTHFIFIERHNPNTKYISFQSIKHLVRIVQNDNEKIFLNTAQLQNNKSVMSFEDKKSHSSKECTSDSSSSIATFVVKIYNLLGDPQNACAICWDEGGRSFTIKNQALLTSKVLPHYFRHNNYQSFIRQLNMYSFTKLKDPQAHRFQNRHFIREREDLLKNIKRKPEKKKRRQSDDSIPNQKENQLQSQMPSLKNIIFKKLECENLKIQCEQVCQKPIMKKVGFSGLNEQAKGGDSEDHISTIIEPTIKWINNKDEPCCWTIKSNYSIEISMKLIKQDEEKQDFQAGHMNQRHAAQQNPILLFNPDITLKTIKQL